MSDNLSSSPRRRPVDVLFGEDVELKPKPNVTDTATRTPQSSGYMVEPPRPVTSLRPPPPEFPTEWRVPTPPEPATFIEPPMETLPVSEMVAPPPKPVMTEAPVVEVIPEAVTFTVPGDVGGGKLDDGRPAAESGPRRDLPAPMHVASAPMSQATAPAPPTPVALPAATLQPMYGQPELVELSVFVDQLYQNVADETSDSAALNAECLTNLNAARAAIEKRDYVKAEAAAEQVKARLLRARASRSAAAEPRTQLIMVWLGVAAFLGLVLFVLPFGLRIVPVVIPLLRGAGLGMLGGAAIALYQMSHAISRREYDAAFNFRLALSPLIGALIGGVLYLLSLLGILAAPNALGLAFAPFALMYLFALLGGIFNDAIVNSIRGGVAMVTHKSLA